MDYKILFLIIDGVGDHGNREFFYGKTPLEAAKKTNMDKICRDSECGLVHVIDVGIVPGSDTGHLALFGYDPFKYYKGRGIFEALGLNIDLKPGDIAFRINFATISEDGTIIDRRAQRNDFGINTILLDFKEILKKIEEEYNIEIIIRKGVEHRGALVIRGVESEKVSETDTHRENEKIRKIEPLEEKANKTAEILNKILNEFYEFSKKHPMNIERKKQGLLPVNYLLIRGASRFIPLDKDEYFEKRYGLKGIFIAGAFMYLGVAKYVGLDVYKPPGATGTVNTSLVSKAEAAIEKRDKYDIVFVHIKATDSLSHDKKPKEKKEFIEKIDEVFFARVKDEFDIIVVTGDHSTSSILGTHISDPVPIMIYSPINRKDPVKNFAERKCYKGILGQIKGTDIMKIILSKINKAIWFGT